ncbi:beta-1,6-galactosyltransferase GALT29A-like [Silene latifolia]|uniref:beta-1,6-galactosyltransferase GALT29A-like n=1 Tax=Silene latifolia TaxID=37657 RepID=UPI003D78502D
MAELINQVKVPIDGQKDKYSSCAVVGNSGILLNKEYGELIDSHEAVIRLNNARIRSYRENVGSKTSISFVNSNIVHLCTRSDDCFCHPYGTNVPIVMYMCQLAQFLDYVVCNLSHKSPLIITDPRFDMLCARVVKYYSLKRFANEGSNRTFEQWNSANDGSLFHYSSGMQAVTLALGICNRVSLFGFGKSSQAKHHYHSRQTTELRLHDYEAEYDFYHDLVKKPDVIPFFPQKFGFPPVVIHR